MRKLLLVAAALVIVVPCAGCGIGDRVHDFELESLDGDVVRLQDYVGEVVVLLDFSATWCPPCSLAVPMLKKLHRDYANDLEILAVYVGESDEVVAKYVRDHGIRYTVLPDPTGAVGRKYGVRGIPTFVVIGVDGHVKYRGHNVNAAARIIGDLLAD